MNLARLSAWAVALSIPVSIVVSYATLWVDDTPAGLVGSTWYGYPVAWAFKAVVAPIFNPWSYDYTAFAEDVLFWFAVCFFIIYMASWVAALAMEGRSTEERAS
jgi:hypothetical protein